MSFLVSCYFLDCRTYRRWGVREQPPGLRPPHPKLCFPYGDVSGRAILYWHKALGNFLPLLPEINVCDTNSCLQNEFYLRAIQINRVKKYPA